MALRWLKFDIFASCRPKAEEEIKDLKEEIKDLKEERQALRSNNEGLRSNNEDLRAENSRMKAVLQRLGLERLSQEGISRNNTLKNAFINRLSRTFRRQLNFALQSQEPGDDMLEYRDVLGEGSFGTVALAFAEQRGYAVKVPLEARHAEALRQEAEFMLRLPHHAHIVDIEGAYAMGRDVSIALELGTYDMHKAVVDRRNTRKDLVRFMGDVAEGIQHMHRHGMVHSDVKLANIIIFELAPGRFIAKVTDFGCASYIGDLKEKDEGTLGTRPLELSTGPVVAVTSQDVFSLGAMLAQVMVHRHLFRDNLFAHEDLWDEDEENEIMDLYGYQKEEYLEELSLKKMDDDGIYGFRMGMLRPINLAPMPINVEEEVCIKMRSYVDPVPDLRPSVKDFLAFTRNLIVHVT